MKEPLLQSACYTRSETCIALVNITQGDVWSIKSFCFWFSLKEESGSLAARKKSHVNSEFCRYKSGVCIEYRVPELSPHDFNAGFVTFDPLEIAVI